MFVFRFMCTVLIRIYSHTRKNRAITNRTWTLAISPQTTLLLSHSSDYQYSDLEHLRGSDVNIPSATTLQQPQASIVLSAENDN